VDLVLPHIGLIARFLLGLDVLALITLLGGADVKRQVEEWWGKRNGDNAYR
jgi:hypothetical protein